LVDILKTGYYFLYGGVEGIKLGREKMLNITHTEAIANADLYITDTSPFAISSDAAKITTRLRRDTQILVSFPRRHYFAEIVLGEGYTIRKAVA